MTETQCSSCLKATQITELPNGGAEVIFDSRPKPAAKKGELLYHLDDCLLLNLNRSIV